MWCLSTCATTDLRDVIARLKMKQGFDVGLEMSGNQRALDQMVEAMTMGGRIAMLGIPPGKSPRGLEPDRLQGDHASRGSTVARYSRHGTR